MPVSGTDRLRAWRIRHPEEAKELARQNRLRYKEKHGVGRTTMWYRRQKENNYGALLYRFARDRARVKGIDFDIDVSDIVIPDICPVFKKPFVFDKKGYGADPMSPSLDRIDSTRGYVRGNVAVISHRANSWKSDLSLSEVRALLTYMEEQERS